MLSDGIITSGTRSKTHSIPLLVLETQASRCSSTTEVLKQEQQVYNHCTKHHHPYCQPCGEARILLVVQHGVDGSFVVKRVVHSCESDVDSSKELNVHKVK